jgi:2-iminobutanoate/2-iminopropanoate deaminase
MVNQAIFSPKLPQTGRPFSPGFKSGTFIFTSGQVGTNPQTGKVAPDIEAQTQQTLENVEAVLHAAGYSRKDVAKVTVFLTDIRDYHAMNQVYGSFFSEPYPARSCVEAKLAAPEFRVEIEVIACK